MKYVQVLAVLTVLFWTTSGAWAQFGLYGSPGLVDLPPVQLEGWVGPNEQESTAPPSDAAVAPPRVLAAGSFSQPPVPAYGGPVSPSYGARSMTAVSLMHPSSKKQDPPKKKKRSARKDLPEPTVEHVPSVVDQMLGESDSGFPPPWGPEPGYATGGGCDPWSGCGDCATDCDDSCVPCFEPKWYASLTGLIMARDDKPNKVWVTYEFVAPENQLLHTQQDLAWKGGAEVRFGRYFCCGQWAVEAAYWTLDPFDSMASRTGPGLLATPLEFENVDWATPGLPGPAPGDLFNEAEEHRVWRRNEVHSIELALIRDRVDFVCCGPFQIGWSVGARYFRFEEDLRFGSLDETGIAFGLDPTLEGYLDDKVVNHLVGVQFGCRVDYCRDRWRLYALPRVGIYNNHIQHRFNAYRGDGELMDPSPAAYPNYPIYATKNVVAFLTEIDLGLECQFTARWSATIGYRVTVATGMGLADHQIPFYVVDTPELADIDYNGYLLLHGGYAGVTCRF